MAVTIKQTEAAPAAYPAVPDGLSDKAAALDATALWQRIEVYVAHRWSERAVTWIAEGPGEWVPPLAPATLDTVEVWHSDAWQSVTPPPSPVGGYELGCGTYRIAATVGAAPVPAAVEEAFRRLAEYLAAEKTYLHRPGVSSAKFNVDGLEQEATLSPAWKARSLQLSGAADLLRPYRRA